MRLTAIAISIIIVGLLLSIMYRYYIRGKLVTIYKYTKSDLVNTIEEVLKEYHISYDIVVSTLPAEYEKPFQKYKLQDTDQTFIELEWDSEKSTTFAMKYKWGKLEQSQEIYQYLLERLREGRDEMHFMSKAIGDMLFGILAISSAFFFMYQYFNSLV